MHGSQLPRGRGQACKGEPGVTGFLDDAPEARLSMFAVCV